MTERSIMKSLASYLLSLITIVCLAANLDADEIAVGERQDSACIMPEENKDLDLFTELPPKLKDYDARVHVHISNPTQADTIRKGVIDFFWPNNGLPKGKLPDATVVYDGRGSIPKELNAISARLVARVEKLDVHVDFDYHHYSFLIHPANPSQSKRLVILHQGHQGGLSDGIDTLAERLLQRGFTVLLMQMPLTGWNTDDTFKTPEGNITVHGERASAAHNDLVERLEGKAGSSLRFFIEPVIVNINYFIDRHRDDRDICMIGLSGGGWTTHSASAIDPRIELSVPVAGSFPLFLRPYYPGSEGDLEQYLPALYKELASYLDLYVLGGYGAGRQQIQVLNQYDSCCFYGIGYTLYEKLAGDATSSLKMGNWRCVLDTSAHKHQISDWAIQKVILPRLAAGEEAKSELVKKMESIFHEEFFAVVPQKTFSVADHGAKGDGKTIDTISIQETIDEASAAGGGVITFPEGAYLCGAVFLKSNIELRVDKGVIIRAIQDNSHYPEMPTRIAGVEMKWPAALINVYEQENVRISGDGVIDGDGSFWWQKWHGMQEDYKQRDLFWLINYDCKRVRPVVIWKSKNVLLEDLTIERAGFWTVSVTYSDRVHVDGLVIRNNIGGQGPSTDGIDIDSSKNVLVENCDIDCSDDILCIKSGRDADGLRVNRPSENIVCRNCIGRRGLGLITLGSETSGGIRNVEAYGLRGEGTHRGVRLKSAKGRGGMMENIHFHDIEMDRVGTAFHFWLSYEPCGTIPKDIPEDQIKDYWRVMAQPIVPPEKGLPEFRNIHISNIVAKNSQTAFTVFGCPDMPIHDLYWRDVLIEAKTPGWIRYAKDWKMENVNIKCPDGKLPLLKDCRNVDMP